MNLIASKSKNSATYYVQKSFRDADGKNTTKIFERLGTMKDLVLRFGEEDPLGSAGDMSRILRRKKKKPGAR